MNSGKKLFDWMMKPRVNACAVFLIVPLTVQGIGMILRFPALPALWWALIGMKPMLIAPGSLRSLVNLSDCPSNWNGRKPPEAWMDAYTHGEINSTRTNAIAWKVRFIARRLLVYFHLAFRRMEFLTPVVMFGNGQIVGTRHIPDKRLISQKTMAKSIAPFAAARGTSIGGSSAVRPVPGTYPIASAAVSGFGLFPLALIVLPPECWILVSGDCLLRGGCGGRLPPTG